MYQRFWPYYNWYSMLNNIKRRSSTYIRGLFSGREHEIQTRLAIFISSLLQSLEWGQHLRHDPSLQGEVKALTMLQPKETDDACWATAQNRDSGPTLTPQNSRCPYLVGEYIKSESKNYSSCFATGQWNSMSEENLRKIALSGVFIDGNTKYYICDLRKS